MCDPSIGLLAIRRPFRVVVGGIGTQQHVVSAAFGIPHPSVFYWQTNFHRVSTDPTISMWHATHGTACQWRCHTHDRIFYQMSPRTKCTVRLRTLEIGSVRQTTNNNTSTGGKTDWPQSIYLSGSGDCSYRSRRIRIKWMQIMQRRPQATCRARNRRYASIAARK